MSLRNRIKKSVANANNQMADRELQLLIDTRFDTEKLSPEIKDHAQYQALMSVIQSATERNLSLIELESNIRQLGDESWQLAKELIKAVR